MKTALSIAGTDPSGDAGIQADLKTMTMNGVFTMSAITTLVAQNTTGGRLISQEAVETLKTHLLPIAAVATPNIPEAEILSSMTIHSQSDIEAAAVD